MLHATPMGMILWTVEGHIASTRILLTISLLEQNSQVRACEELARVRSDNLTGCVASDTQGEVTPILVDPDENNYLCSDISTNPDNTNFVSTWYVEYLFTARPVLIRSQVM